MFNEKGQTLLELIVVISVSVIIIGALVFATIASLRNAQFSKNQSQATKLAQEGIEKVRTGRDRNAKINNVPNSSDCPNVSSWNGDSNGNAIWSCKIYNTIGSGGDGYFRFNTVYPNDLDFRTTSTTFLDSSAEDPLSDGKFKRVVILSDNSLSFGSQKTVTVIVRWNDFSGPHESRLTTILRKI